MFSAPSPGPSTLPTPPRGRRKAIPMAEVADVIVKSSKTPISTGESAFVLKRLPPQRHRQRQEANWLGDSAEAQASLQLLTELCPFFLTCKTIAKQEWLEMPSSLTVSVCPPSPASSTLPPAPPTSPIAKGRVELAGPASPGRVRRVGGLREVRERIRRELGE